MGSTATLGADAPARAPPSPARSLELIGQRCFLQKKEASKAWYTLFQLAISPAIVKVQGEAPRHDGRRLKKLTLCGASERYLSLIACALTHVWRPATINALTPVR